MWLLWYGLAPNFIETLLFAERSETTSEFEYKLMQRELLAMVRGQTTVSPEMSALVVGYRSLEASSQAAMNVVIIALLIGCSVWGMNHNPVMFNARRSVESFVKKILFLASTVAVITTIGIVLSVLYESLKFFQEVSFSEFLFGLNWSHQSDRRGHQHGNQ